MLAPTLPDLTPARPWVPQPYKRLAEVACPSCGGLDGLLHSLTHAYVACLACGWQRRLTTKQDRLEACMAAAIGDTTLWRLLLARLAAIVSDPLPLPPAPALLWRRVAPDVWAGPSRSVAATEYTVEAHGSRLVCSCPNLRGLCWHLDLVRALAGLPAPPPAPRFAPGASVPARAALALADLFGPA